ncbi:MAG: hypothetical protein LBJ88_03635 [Campylobacteraceae bacterium]|jgi:hypothetical protein|nr:hypothetical protein [Campylobacteraceae bacterium]
MSDFPPLDTSGFTTTYEHKMVTYYNNSSTQLAKSFNATVSGKDVTLYNEYYVDDNNFRYDYSLNDLASKGLLSGYIWVESYYNLYIGMVLEANRSISNSEFTNLFGNVDAALLDSVAAITKYEGDMSSEFADYYADISGKFFDINNANVSCNTDDATEWQCDKNDGEFYYHFRFYLYGTDSMVIFEKFLQ